MDEEIFLKQMICALLVSSACGASGLAQAGPATAEQRTIRAFEQARKNPLALRVFLEGMPKGGDLHLHLSGGTVYSETLIRDAVEDGLCVSTATFTLVKPAAGGCGAGSVPASDAGRDQKLYDAMVDAYSMRNFVPTPGVSGHDQFFSTFDKFSAIEPRHVGEWVDEIATRAAEQNEQYIEAMYTPAFANAARLGAELGWHGDSAAEIAKTRDALLSKGLRTEVVTDRQELDGIETQRREIEHCGGASAAVACGVKIRFLYQVLRGFPPQQVFAQTLLGFELASADPRVEGLNFVMPEDGYLSMRDYHLHMLMLAYLHGVYPNVRLTLHAGELAPGMVPPAGLQFHIREAVELAHAERIGHGIDVMYEDHPRELLEELAAKHVMVEINLTSNDVILGVTGSEHPLGLYRAAHVPIALATDDEGVSRIDITHEYEKAVLEQGLGYIDLKEMARTSLEHSFLPGQSLWIKPDDFTRRKSGCSVVVPAAACALLLKSSEKAAQQYELERRFAAFEGSVR